jgi:hypothetical protein
MAAKSRQHQRPCMAQTDYVTKKDLDLAIERLKSELQRFILVSVVLATIAQIEVKKRESYL